MRTVILDITPEMAKEFLKNRNPENRAIRRNTVHSYAEAMKNGGWQLNAEGISFYENGTLRDGHHRLLAIVESGATVRMLVTYDVPNESYICDRGLARSAGDVLKMAGYKALSTNFYSGIINFLLQTAKNSKPNDESLIRFAKEYGEIVKLSGEIACSGGKVGFKAPVAAAIFCAIECGVDEKVLYRFANVLNTGFYDNPAQTSAIVLRNMMSTMTCRANGRKELFSVTTKAIEDFRTCKPRKKAYDKKSDPEYFNRVKSYILGKYI